MLPYFYRMSIKHALYLVNRRNAEKSPLPAAFGMHLTKGAADVFPVGNRLAARDRPFWEPGIFSMSGLAGIEKTR